MNPLRIGAIGETVMVGRGIRRGEDIIRKRRERERKERAKARREKERREIEKKSKRE